MGRLKLCARKGCTATTSRPGSTYCPHHVSEARKCGVADCHTPLGVNNRSGYCAAHHKMARKDDR